MNITRRVPVGISFCLVSLSARLGSATMAADTYTENPGVEGDGHFTIGPEYKLDRDLTDLGNPKGEYFEFTVLLAYSRIFRGDDKTLEPEKKQVRTERKIFVYVPAEYREGTAAPLLIIHD